MEDAHSVLTGCRHVPVGVAGWKKPAISQLPESAASKSANIQSSFEAHQTAIQLQQLT